MGRQKAKSSKYLQGGPRVKRRREFETPPEEEKKESRPCDRERNHDCQKHESESSKDGRLQRTLARDIDQLRRGEDRERGEESQGDERSYAIYQRDAACLE